MDHWTLKLNQSHTYEEEKAYQDDSTWILTSSFIIFTMQSGFGLLESGRVSAKDEVNIMVKGVVDVVFGGLSYWMVAFGLSFGEDFHGFVGIAKFFYDPDAIGGEVWIEGWSYSAFLFQLSFATTASTIVAGAMAERVKLKSYIVFASIVVLIFALPAHWVWSPHGVFRKMGVVDFAGCAPVHLVGGVVGLVSTIYLKPRQNRFGPNGKSEMSSPTNALLGTFMLWWGWLGFNTGCTWGITGGRWRLASRSAVSTMLSSIGGGVMSIIISVVATRKCHINFLIDGLLSALVSVTAICAVARPWQSLLIGMIGATLALSTVPLLERLQIDDPVGIIPVHVVSSIWGMLAVGLFAKEDRVHDITHGSAGLFYSGSFRLLGIQALTTVAVSVWCAVIGFFLLLIIDKSPLGLRMSSADELIGADVLEHGLTGHNIAGYDVEDTVKNTRAFGSAMQALSKWKAITRTSAIRRKEEEERIKQASSWLEHEQPIHESHKPSSARTSISAVVLGNASNCNGAQARRQQLRRSYTTDV